MGEERGKMERKKKRGNETRRRRENKGIKETSKEQRQ